MCTYSRQARSVYTRVPAGGLIQFQISLSGARHYKPSFSDSRTERMSALSCGACSSPPPSCPESSAQPNECIRCTVPGLSAATNYTVTVTALSDAGTGASSSNVTSQTMAFSELASSGSPRWSLTSRCTWVGVHVVHACSMYVSMECTD